MKVQVQASEILEYIKEGVCCKIEVDKQGEAYVLPLEAYGFEDTILTQVIEAYHYEEMENDAEFIDWVKYIYNTTELEATNNQLIKIEIL